jgi:hypothetical protein
VLVIIVIVVSNIRILYVVNIFHPGEIWGGLLRTCYWNWRVLLSLTVKTGSPLSHGLLIREFDNEVLDTRIAFPPYLYRV